MTDPTTRALAQTLKPLVSRMRRDVTAKKGKSGSYWTQEPLTLELLEHHVNGGPARGLCPIKPGESVTMVACLDFDSHGGETPWAGMAEAAGRVSEALLERGVRVHPFRSSGGRGVHLIAMWEQPQDAYSVRTLLGEALGACGLRDGAGGVAAGQVEVYPRQNEVGVGEYGNQFILPLAGKSEPLDPLFGLEPMGKSAALDLVWVNSDAVPVRERPVREASSSSPPDEIARVRQALFAIPNDPLFGEVPDYFAWRNLAFAVHEATGGSDEGYELFAEWSAQNPLHDEKFTRSRVWDCVRDTDQRTSGAITRGTLYHQAGLHGWAGSAPALGDADGFDDVEPEQAKQLARAAGVEAAQQALVAVAERREALFEAKERWRAAILSAPDERQLVTVICPQIAADAVLDSTTRGMLAEVLKTTLGKLGSKAGIADCRKLIAPPKRERQAGAPKGHWSDGWVYVTDEDSFYRLDSEEVLSMQSFNAKFNRFLPPAEDGEFRKNAAWVALEECSIPTVTRRVYLPWAQEMFELNGVACANSFRPSSMPETAAEFSADGASLIERIKRHIGLICGGRQDVAEVLISWMAFQVQQPGRKVRWAPIIKGVQGDGKTLLGAVLSAALGMPNVKVVGPQVLGTSFQDWAHGACVGVLEEIRLSGHNRFEVLDTLKPYVTNNAISIHPKGAKPFDVINTQNYLAFTNHSDALPIDETDRRWFVIFTPMTSIADLEKAVGELGAYFDSIYDNLERYAGEVRKWLMEWVLHPRFKPNGRAMSTDEKASMIAMSVSSEEDFVREAISQGGEGIVEQVVVVGSLVAAVNSMGVDEPISFKTAALTLKKMGWIKVEGALKWRGKVVRAWVKGISPTDNLLIRSLLNKTEGSGCEIDDPFKEIDGSELPG